MCEVKAKIKFGTDGWRGVISDDFTFVNVRRVAQAAADFYNGKSGGAKVSIAVGYDMRFMSRNYAKIVSEVLADNGIDVVLSDQELPTPTLSFAVKKRKLTAGIMITASHNPQEYNGIKIKTAEGGAAGADITKAVEKFIDDPAPKGSRPAGNIAVADMTKDYVAFLKSYVNLKKFKNAKFKILVDAMHGSGRHFLADALKGSNVKIEFFRSDRNPSFGEVRPEPVPENLQATFAKMKKDKYDLCVVLDGDADRVAAIAGNGEFVSPQKILGLLMLHLIQDRGMDGGIVKTVVGSNLIDKITSKYGWKLYETPVGFKYISELMVKENIVVGGEEAGGMGFKNYIPERDGSLAGMLLMEMMAHRKKSFLQLVNDMEKEFGRYYYLRDAITLKAMGLIKLDQFRQMKEVLGKKVVKINDTDGLKFILSDESWFMLRASGTEPIVRIYAESKSLKDSRAMIEFGRQLILKNAL